MGTGTKQAGRPWAVQLARAWALLVVLICMGSCSNVAAFTSRFPWIDRAERSGNRLKVVLSVSKEAFLYEVPSDYNFQDIGIAAPLPEEFRLLRKLVATERTSSFNLLTGRHHYEVCYLPVKDIDLAEGKDYYLLVENNGMYWAPTNVTDLLSGEDRGWLLRLVVAIVWVAIAGGLISIYLLVAKRRQSGVDSCIL